MAETTNTTLSTSLAGFYAKKAAEKKQERAQAEYQKEYEKAVAEQTAAQAAQAAEAEREKNAGGFFGGIGYSLEKIGLGFLSGIEGIWDYTAGGLAKLFGADDWAEQQIANDWVDYNHADEWFNPSEGWQFVGDVAGGIGTSLPAIAGVAAAGAITFFSGGSLSPLAASLIAGSVAGLGAAGRATKEAYDQTGELTGKEFGYGALQGITEAAIEGVSAGIGAGTGAIVKNISKSFGKEVAQSATRQTLIKGMLKGFAGEAFEEGVQAILEPYYKRLTYDPNAKNATFQEVAYAALVGGLSGAIMGGADISIRNIHGASRGSSLVQNGKSGDVITTAEQISNYQTENNTDYQSFQLVQNTLTELQNSMQKTDGQVQTIKQKMLLGVLEQANTTAAFEPIVTSSAENIYNNAEAIAAKLNELGYTDTNGKPIQVTAEQLREGIDTTNAKTLRKTMSQALKTNSALRTLAVADAIGQLSMDTAKFKDATLRGQRLSTQADLNRFIEQSTDTERQAVAEKLGIENWETLTNDVFQTKIAEFVANGGVESYQQEHAFVKEANAVTPENAKKALPRMVNLRNDGTYRYTQGNTDIAVIKRGDTYYVYDYDSKRMSKPLSRTETNKVLREIHTNETNYTEGVRQHNEAQNRLKQQAAELDTYAREKIADYKNASSSGQAAIRAVLRQGKALGLQEDFVLSCARVSARSGLHIAFSREASFVAANGSYADGAIDLANNRIIINPEAKSRSGESILIHELTHAIYNLSDGTLQVAEGLETMTDAEKENIRKRYSAVGQGNAVQVGDEINAHFAEQTLSNKNILERLVEKKPTVKDKILGFFKKAKTEYAGDEKLSGAAARLYRQYKKLFDDFAERNQRYLGVESEATTVKTRQALPEIDNQGNKLSSEQREFFKNTVITDARGNLLVLYHQTDADFTVFDPFKAGAGARDNETPYGIFMKPTTENIGLRGNKQMPLYANIQNPLRFIDRTQAQQHWRENIEGYGKIIDQLTANDTKYNEQFEEAFSLERFARLKKLELKKLDRAEQDVLFEQSERETDKILREWQTANATLDIQAKELINEYLQNSKYDGVILEYDKGSMGRMVRSIIALEPNQVKNTDNMIPTKADDIRFALTNDETLYENGDLKLLFDEEFYKAYENESREPIKESIAELEKIKASPDFEKLPFEETYDTSIKLKALKAGYGTLYDYYVGIEKARLLSDYQYSLETGKPTGAMSIIEKKKVALAKKQRLQKDIAESTPHKNAQFDIIQKTNPMFNDTSVGIRSPKDIKTFDEVINDPDSFCWGDFSVEDAKKALKKGAVRVFSSYPIKNGVFVSTSYQQALDYAGSDPNGVHSRVVALDSVAWINGDEGQYAKVYEVKKYALPETDSIGNKLSEQQREFFKDSKVVDENGNLLVTYHGTPNSFFTFDRNRIGKGNDQFGAGFYFATNEDASRHYGNNIYKTYLNFAKPIIINRTADGGDLFDVKITQKQAFEILKRHPLMYNSENSPLGDLFEEYWEIGAKDYMIREAAKNLNTIGLLDSDYTAFRDYPNELHEAIRDVIGYDGVEVRFDNSSDRFYVAWFENQIKLTTNKKPSKNPDLRFAINKNEDGNQFYGGYSVGQRAHFAANNTGMRVYTKAEATDVINSIIEERLVFDKMGMYCELRGKDRQQVIDYLYTKLNTVKEGYRTGVALKIADYLIENTVLTDMYADSDTSESMRILSVLRGYMHKLDLKGIQSEIQYKFDNKNSASLVWGAKEGGIAPDTLPQVLAEEGIFIESENEADIFFEMLDRYQAARAEVYKATDKIKLSEFGDAKTIKDLRQQIARDILNAYDQKGSKSKYAKLVEKYTTQINNLKTRLREVNAQNRLINSIVDRAQKMRDLKLGTFLNSSQYKIDVFKRSIETLAKLKYRGNFNIGGTRKVMAELRTWYTKENPILSDTYEEGIAEMLDTIANGTKGYTKTELQMINDVMAYFTNYVEKFNKVYRNGKWIDAIPEATRYIDTIHSNEQVKVGLFRKMTGSTYMQTFGDPMTVARRMDMYENGFYTEMLTELREATIDAEITEMEVKSYYEAFLKKNKKYLADAMKQTVKYREVDIPRLQLIGLYMTLKRNHAQAGLAQNGFAFTDNNGKRVRVQGFNPEITEESDLRSAALDEQSTIEELLSDADKEYITILEKVYNQDAKKLKADRDIQRLGFTNATEEYYYPIRRGNIAKNVDTSDIQGELDRVSSSSFNKDTVRGAKQELYIESADVIFNRHIHAVTQYAALSPAIETYNRLYNLDIGGNPNKPVSVATESANTWTKGSKYFSKLISDIQGMPSVSGEGMKALGFIRGSYAKFQLGANPKVWVTQLSSLFASSSILDAGSITKGMFVSAKGVDTYCPLAKLRNSDNTAAMAQGVIDKVGKVSNVLMAPIGKMDRFVVCRLFGACQVQVEKNGGAKIGTETNKVEAGKLLKRVILETQQNTMATERSAAMRSGNEVLRTLTMFSADSMKVVGRVIDAFGELATLRARLRITTDTTKQGTLKTQIKVAHKKVFKSVTSLALSGLFMAGVAQLFKWLYDKDRDEDETVGQEVLVDFIGNLFGGLPLIKDVYARITEGYSIENYTYSTINDLLDSAERLMNGTGTTASRVRNLAYSVGQLFGIPTRNLYNVFYGLTKRISPTSAYKIDNKLYKKNYVTDLNKAIENDDTDMIAMLMSMILDERIEGSTISDTVSDKLSDLYGKGYSVLPKSISDTITYNKSEIPLSDKEYQRFKTIYSQAMKDLEKMIKNGLLDTLPEEKQVKAIKQLYDAYYYNALTDLVGVDERTTVGELSQYMDIGRLSVAFAGLSEIASDKNSKGETITGSQKKNTVDYLLKQNLTDGERLLILCYRGYTIQNGDYKGYSAKRAKSLLLKYILSLRVSQVQKATIASKCGFTVRNGKIVKDF